MTKEPLTSKEMVSRVEELIRRSVDEGRKMRDANSVSTETLHARNEVFHLFDRLTARVAALEQTLEIETNAAHTADRNRTSAIAENDRLRLLVKDSESLLTMHDRSPGWLKKRDALLVRLRATDETIGEQK